MNVNRLSPVVWLRLVPPTYALVAFLLLSAILVFSVSVAFGHAKQDGSFFESDGLQPDVNRDHDLIVDEDFENGVGVGMTLNNGAVWVCEDGNCFVKQVANISHDLAPGIFIGKNSWQNYTLKFRFNVQSGTGGPQVGWHVNSDGAYVITANGQSGFRFVADKLLPQNTSEQHAFNDINSPFRAGTWNTLEVQANGDRVRVFLNGDAVADESVPPEFKSDAGIVTIKTLPSAGGDLEIWYDDIEVRLLNLSEPLPEQPPATNQSSRIVIDEDFEFGIPSGFNFKNGAQLVCQEGNCFVKQVATSLMTLFPNVTMGENSWGDYSFKFRFNVRSGNGGPHVVWHETVDGRYFITATGQSGFQLRAEKKLASNQRQSHAFNDIKSPFTKGEWNTLEVQAEGDRIRLILNGQTMMDQVVPADFVSLHGKSSFRTLAAAGGDLEVWYDDVELRLLNVPEPTLVPTPTPRATPTAVPTEIPLIAPAVGMEAVLDEDFEDGIGPYISLLHEGSSLVCEDGNCFVKHVTSTSHDKSPNLWIGFKDLVNYSFRYRFNVRSSHGGPTANIRHGDRGRYVLRPSGQFGFQLSAYKTDSLGVETEHRIKSIIFPYPIKEWNTMEIQAFGDRIRVILNDRVLADEIIPEDFRTPAGAPSAATYTQSGGVEIWYDDLEVRLISIPESASIPTVRPSPTRAPRPTQPPTSIPSSATNRESKVVVTLDFESGIPSGISLNNGAIVACEEGNCFSKHVATPTQRSSPNVWFSRYILEDYAFRFRFNVRSGNGGPSVVWHWTEDGAYQINPIGQNGFAFFARKTIERNVNDKHQFNDIKSAYATREWNTLEVRADGDRISVLLNDNIVADVTVPEEFRFMVGLPAVITNSVAGEDIEIWYDDFEMRTLGDFDSAPPAPVSPQTSTPATTTVAEPSDSTEPPDEKSSRGFFTNTKPGESTLRANSLLDPTTLAVIGILITMVATMVQLFRGQ